MKIITKRSLEELKKSGVNCDYALSPNGRDFWIYSTGKTHNEAFDDFVDLLEEEAGNYGGVCEMRESNEHQNRGLITLLGRVITIPK